jgi:hypothetical protein
VFKKIEILKIQYAANVVTKTFMLNVGRIYRNCIEFFVCMIQTKNRVWTFLFNTTYRKMIVFIADCICHLWMKWFQTTKKHYGWQFCKTKKRSSIESLAISTLCGKRKISSTLSIFLRHRRVLIHLYKKGYNLGHENRRWYFKGIVSRDLMRIKRPADGFIGYIISPGYSWIGFTFNFKVVFMCKFFIFICSAGISLGSPHLLEAYVPVNKCSNGTWGTARAAHWPAHCPSWGAPL